MYFILFYFNKMFLLFQLFVARWLFNCLAVFSSTGFSLFRRLNSLAVLAIRGQPKLRWLIIVSPAPFFFSFLPLAVQLFSRLAVLLVSRFDIYTKYISLSILTVCGYVAVRCMDVFCSLDVSLFRLTYHVSFCQLTQLFVAMWVLAVQLFQLVSRLAIQTTAKCS